jgi:hypothetical protein
MGGSIYLKNRMSAGGMLDHLFAYAPGDLHFRPGERGPPQHQELHVLVEQPQGSDRDYFYFRQIYFFAVSCEHVFRIIL